MKDKLREMFSKSALQTHKLILNTEDKRVPKSVIGEAALSLAEFSQLDIVVPYEKVLALRAFSYGIDMLDESLFYYTSYHKSWGLLKEGTLEENQQNFSRMNTDTLAMILKINASDLGHYEIGGSIDNYFFSRMDRPIWSIRKIIRDKISDLFIPAIYTLCSFHQTLCFYLSGRDTKFENEVVNLLSEVSKLLGLALQQQEISNRVALRPQLWMFIEAQRCLYQRVRRREHTPSVLDLDYSKLGLAEMLRILTSFHTIDRNKFLEELEKAFGFVLSKSVRPKNLDTALLLRCAGKYMALGSDDDLIECGLSEKPSEEVDIYESMCSLFQKYDELASIEVSDEDIKVLYDLDDNNLRQKLAHTIKGVNPAILLQEASKPHGSAEIADMVMPVMLGYRRVFLCIPVKSGREIRTKTVPVGAVYHRLINPFLDFSFNGCLVVFVTAKRCSLQLTSYIKKDAR
jgi:hypothetical protein